MKKYLLPISILLILLTLNSYSQCAMCKAAAESTMEGDPNSVARGLNKGILFLLALPYLVTGFIFRNEIKYLFKLMRGIKEQPEKKINWGNFTFALSFITVLVVLFIVFLMVHPSGA